MGYTADHQPASPAAVDAAEEALAAVAARYGTDPNELLRGVVEKRLAMRVPLKGGVNLVGEDMFVAPGNERNKLIVGEKREDWVGAPRSQSQVVVLSSKAVLGSIAIPEGLTPRDMSVVWFQPDKVFFLDGEAFELGHFARPKPE
ncbi:hypothetical protein NR798_18685 [Archangium gephyra]|uniref:hypothetical protein n=1 Tax=Archangium gephyra TaxID=48 RepID=UPI0035D4434D